MDLLGPIFGPCAHRMNFFLIPNTFISYFCAWVGRKSKSKVGRGYFGLPSKFGFWTFGPHPGGSWEGHSDLSFYVGVKGN